MNAPVLPDLRSIMLDTITQGNRLRDVCDDEVSKLCQSIDEHGLQNPIVVRPFRIANPKDLTKWGKSNFESGYILVSGCHRLHAFRSLGWKEIPAIVLDPVSPLEARILEIDENLFRHELNALDRATFLAERKVIYEELHPETKHGAQGGIGGKKNENEIISFSLSTAEKVGLSKRTIEMCVKIHNGLAPETRDRIKGTWIALKQGELLLLAGCDQDQQGKITELLLREKDPLKSVSKAKKHLAGHVETPTDQTDQARIKLFRAWENAPKPVRRDFLKMLKEEGIAADLPEQKEAA